MIKTYIIFRQPGAVKDDTLSFDASVEESYKYTSKVTMYPIEKGENVSDHIQTDPPSISMEGFIANSPLSQPLILSADGTQAKAPDSWASRVQNAIDALESIYTNRIVVTIVTGAGVFFNQAMTSFTYPRNISVGDGFKFSLDFIEIRKVSLSSISVSKTSSGKGKQKTGFQPMTVPQTEQEKSYAASIFDFFAGVK